jgi:hypothetical protein
MKIFLKRLLRFRYHWYILDFDDAENHSDAQGLQMSSLWARLGSKGLYSALLREVQEPILGRTAPEDGVKPALPFFRLKLGGLVTKCARFADQRVSHFATGAHPEEL